MRVCVREWDTQNERVRDGARGDTQARDRHPTPRESVRASAGQTRQRGVRVGHATKNGGGEGAARVCTLEHWQCARCLSPSLSPVPRCMRIEQLRGGRPRPPPARPRPPAALRVAPRAGASPGSPARRRTRSRTRTRPDRRPRAAAYPSLRRPQAPHGRRRQRWAAGPVLEKRERRGLVK